MVLTLTRQNYFMNFCMEAGRDSATACGWPLFPDCLDLGLD